MDASRFDRISKLLAGRRARSAPARARPAAQGDATPTAPDQPGHAPELLFVQSFRAGAITAKEGADGRYTLALEAGTGQTVYFSDRPDRRVGATPTDEFLDRLGFPADNPPNAALVVETAPGETDIAVVELFSPVYDEASGSVTYEAAPLANWQAELGVGLGEAPADLAALAPSFGAAHLFIDGLYDCPDGDIVCRAYGGSQQVIGTITGEGSHDFCSHYLGRLGDKAWFCVPCITPTSVLVKSVDRNKGGGTPQEVWAYWGDQCNRQFAACNGNCRPTGWCEMDPYHQTICPSFS